MPRSPETVEPQLRALIARGQIDLATDRAIRLYGPEIVGWLCKILPDDADAHDAFSWMCEHLWRSLPRHEGRCSIRVWCYMLARQGAYRVRTRPERRHEQLVSNLTSNLPAAAHVWGTTRRDELRADDVFDRIRRTLADEDQTLLILRVDRNLPWRDIAVVLLGEDATDDDLARKAAALRKQFERVKLQLRALAAEQLTD